MSEAANAVAAPVVTQSSTETKTSPVNGTENQIGSNAVAKQLEEFFEIPVNGKTQKLSREQVIARAAQSSAAQDRFEKANKIFAEMRQNKESMKKDLFGSLLADKDLGFQSKEDLRKKIEEYYKQEFIDPEMMTHEQRRIAELERSLKAKEAKEADDLQKMQAFQREQEDKVALETLQTDIIGSLEKSGLPKNRFTVSRMAYWMQQNMARGFDAPMEVVVAQVRDEMGSLLKEQLSTASIEQLVPILGDEFFKKLRQFDLQRLKGHTETHKATPRVASTKTAERTRPSDVSDYFRSLRMSKK